MSSTQFAKNPEFRSQQWAKSCRPVPASCGVVNLWKLNKDFEDGDLFKFLSQFGKVSRLQVKRSHKTGGSKGACLVEFTDKEVAEVVAKELDHFFVWGHPIRARMLDEEEVKKPNLFKGCFSEFKPMSVEKKQKVIEAINASADSGVKQSKLKRKAAKRASLQKFLEAQGVDFQLPSLKTTPSYLEEKEAEEETLEKEEKEVEKKVEKVEKKEEKKVGKKIQKKVVKKAEKKVEKKEEKKEEKVEKKEEKKEVKKESKPVKVVKKPEVKKVEPKKKVSKSPKKAVTKVNKSIAKKTQKKK